MVLVSNVLLSNTLPLISKIWAVNGNVLIPETLMLTCSLAGLGNTLIFAKFNSFWINPTD